jgi:hypothetical protein
MERIFVKPAPGMQCRLPGGALISPAGQKVDLTPFIRRRLADGDVVKAKPPAAAGSPRAAQKPSKSSSGTTAGPTTHSEE